VSALFLEEAEEEMYEAAAFYEGRTDGLGDRFLDDIQACVDRISERPHMGRRVGGHFRVVLAKRFPFSVIYALEEATIVIVAVAHQRRRPGYWRDRYAR
jgi:plasmid stabilization system protein ParE